SALLSVPLEDIALVSGDARGIQIGTSELLVQPGSYNHLAEGEQEVIVYRYIINDGQGGSVDQSASITIAGTNDVPTVSSAIAIVSSEDSDQIQIDLLSNATDVDESDVLSLQEGSLNLLSGDDSGVGIEDNLLTVELSSYQYLLPGESNLLEYSYTIEDGNGGTVVQRAVITITGSNDGPQVTESIIAEASEDDSTFSVDMLAGVTDVDDAHNLSVSNVSLVSGDGQGVIVSGNQLQVDPSFYQSLAEGESESLVYVFDVEDGFGESVSQTATITLLGTNDAPEVSAQVMATAGDQDNIFTVDLLEHAFDIDAGDTLSVVSDSIALSGGNGAGITANGNTLSVNPTAYRYLAEGEQENIRYDYTVSDGKGGTVPQSVMITVDGSNDQPVVENVNVATVEDSLVTGSFSVTDEDDSDTHSFTILTQPGDGSVTNNNDGTFSFDPGSAFQGLAEGESREVSFTYVAVDNSGSANASSEEKTVTITVTGTNDEPEVSQSIEVVSEEDADAFAVDLLEHASDVDRSDSLSVLADSITLISGDARGVQVGSNQLLVQPHLYNNLPAGEQEIIVYRYTLEDGEGGSVEQTASITVSGSNDAPTVSSAISVVSSEDGSQIQVDLLKNAVDVDDSDTLGIKAGSISLISGDDTGVMIVDNVLTVGLGPYQYLAESETNLIEYSYIIQDSKGGEVAQRAIITITGRNDGPQVTASINVEASEDDSAFNVNLLSGVSDVDDAENLSVSNLSLTSGNDRGVTIAGHELFVDPASYQSLSEGESESVVYVYDVEDGSGGIVSQTATVTITGTNDKPIVESASIQAVEDTVFLEGRFLVTDTDSSDTHSFQIISQPSEGSVINNGDGSFSFNPGSGFQDLGVGETRQVTFTYEAVDDSGAGNDTSEPGIIMITVTGTNDRPVAEVITGAAVE
ncbi:MAG: cadherin-like domain-containing protein, partial [Endozoicomonas sp.]